MVETTPTILKKPWFKDPKKFLQGIIQQYHGKDARDVHGNTLAHLSVLCGDNEYLHQVPHLLDIKNKEEVTPRDLMQLLGRPIEGAKLAATNGLYVYKTQNQTYVHLSQEETQSCFHIEYLDHLVFEEVNQLQWVLKRCQKKLLDPAIKRKNQWIDSLYGTPFLSRKLPVTYVKWINPLMGYGLFAGADIPQYSLIGEYTGVVRRRKYRLDKYNDYIFGYVATDSSTPFVIDAKEKGNHTRFINHSDDPNLYSTWLVLKNVCHVILVTREAISKDTQLTYDYGATYWKKRSDPLSI